MTRRDILVRHGNTFEADQTPVWCGARTDLPLTAFGRTQAEAAGTAFRDEGLSFGTIITGPLRRTHETATIVARQTGYGGEIAIDPRLREIDYGAWEGRSNAEIDALGRANERAAWDRDAVWPTSPCWSPDAATLAADARALLGELPNGLSLIVTSNGILRFYAALAVNAAAFPMHKVATGHICLMHEQEDGWRIAGWNEKPDGFHLSDIWP